MSKRKEKDKPQGGGFGRGPSVGRPAEKAKNPRMVLRRLGRYLASYKWTLILVVIMSILSTLFGIISPKILGMATQTIYEGVFGQTGINYSVLLNIIYILAGAYVLSSIFRFFQGYLMSSVTQKTVYELRNEVSEKFHKLPISYYDKRTKGEVLSRVTNDIELIGRTLQEGAVQLITSIISIIGVIVMMFSIDIWLSLITLLTLPLSILIVRGVASRSQKQFKVQRTSLGDLNGHIEEMYTGHSDIKAYNREEKSREVFNEYNEELYKSSWKAQFLSGLIMPLMNFVTNIGYVIVTVVGGIFVTQGRLNIGDIQAFIQYSRQFGQPIVQVGNIANTIQSTIAAAERVFEVLDEANEVIDFDTRLNNDTVKGHVSFENINFGYDSDNLLMENLSIDVKAGETIAIVGPTGAGKTTLVNLLMRFYEINSGSITVDGVDIASISRENLRNNFGMVLQDTWLFNGSIKDNIAYGVDSASFDDIEKAATLAHADHFIKTLPKGYDTIINEEASNISQGQKQLITIARALLADPKILILDEATSSVDTRTEAMIQMAMNNLMNGRTNFVIAHRLSTIKDADRILVMNDGTIIEQGNHDSLMDQNGFYAELYMSQFTSKKVNE